jgi:hypothetical protein
MAQPPGALHVESPRTFQMMQHLQPAQHDLLPLRQAYLKHAPVAPAEVPAAPVRQQILQVGGQPPVDHASVPDAWTETLVAPRATPGDSITRLVEERHTRKLDDSVSRPWSQQELESLAVIVCQDGPGNWGDKALLLGTGRTAASTGSAWRRYERQVKDGTREPLPNMPPMATPCPTARMGSTVGYKKSATPGVDSSDPPPSGEASGQGVLARYSLRREAHKRLRGVWPIPAFVQLTFDAPGPTGISWCCREIISESNDDGSPPQPIEKQREQDGVGEIEASQASGVDMDEVLRRHLPPMPWSAVRKAGNVDDCSGKCVALIESVEPGSAADALVSTLPSTERALLLREGIDVCLEAINGQSVHNEQQSYTMTLRSLRLTRRPLTLLVRTHAIGTEPTLLRELSKLPISTLQQLQPQTDWDAHRNVLLHKTTHSGNDTNDSADVRDEEEEEPSRKAEETQQQPYHEGQERQNVQECDDEDERHDDLLHGQTYLQDLFSDDITTDDEGYTSDAWSVADSIDYSPSCPSPIPGIGVHEDMLLLLEGMKPSAPSLFSALPPVIVSDWIGKSWPAEWEACIQDPYEGDADGDSLCGKMTDEEDVDEQGAEEEAIVMAGATVGGLR